MAKENNVVDWAELNHAPPPPSGPPRWLLSFVDLTGILVAFFVLLFSMKEPDMQRWKQLQSSMHKAFTQHSNSDTPQLPQGRLNAEHSATIKSDGAQYLEQLLERRLQSDPLWGGVQGTASNGYFELPVPPSLASGLNSVQVMTSGGQAAVARLAAVIRNWDNPVLVVVHDGGKNKWETFDAAVTLAKTLEAAGVAATAGGVAVQMAPTGAGDDASLTLQIREQQW